MMFLIFGRTAPPGCPNHHQLEIQHKISHWDTGLLFAYDYSKYHHGRLGPVCQGSRDFTINETFGKVACNGKSSAVVQPHVRLSPLCDLFFREWLQRTRFHWEYRSV